MDLTLRSTEKELMDEPDLEFNKLKETFDDINRVNTWLGGNQVTINAVLEQVAGNPKKTYTILDVGCGDGNMLRQLAIALRKKNVSATLTGVELREDVAQLARKKSTDHPQIQIEQGDLFQLHPSQFSSDIVLCTLTLHHFSDAVIDKVMLQLVALSKEAVIINDLHRSALACWLFRIFSFFLLKTYMAKNDGLVSIKRGFLKQELVAHSKKIPNLIFTIRWKWAFRYIWILKPRRTQ